MTWTIRYFQLPWREARPIARRRMIEAGVRPRKVERRLRVVDAIIDRMEAEDRLAPPI